MGRPDSGRLVQLGVETTSGTPVAANKLLASLSFDLNTEVDRKTYRAQGYNVPTVSRVHRILQRGTWGGPLNYNEIVYPLSSFLGDATITTPSGGTSSRQWLFTKVARGRTTPRTFTIEEGDTDAATQSSYVAATSIDIDFAEDDVTVGGGLLGREGVSGSLTSSPTAISQVIAGADQIDVYMGSTLGAMGAGGYATLYQTSNKITDAMRERFTSGDKYLPKHVHNTTYTSYKDITEQPIEPTFEFTTEHNAQSRTLYDAAKSNAFRYIGVRATGPIIESTISYLFELTMAVDIVPRERTSIQGVWGYTYDCLARYDATLNSAFQFRVVNTLTAL